ncbi:hypothetical protein KUTeg_011462 [Tegillarca granosa]|uniref:beta-N-acetylhexosaminidase n=1 Tax=Tegillarca granosa TaxID=220873 RepID=A0ABQ9F0U8_TEGGR|nr:hypothetical protein KUTeg_011462 [Tegillarca granosa]
MSREGTRKADLHWTQPGKRNLAGSNQMEANFCGRVRRDGLHLGQAQHMAKDREKWRELVAALSLVWDKLVSYAHLLFVSPGASFCFDNEGYQQNNEDCLQSIVLTNTGYDLIVPGNWSIYFYSIRIIEPHLYPYLSGLLLSSGVRIYHHTGYLYEIRPDPKIFQPIKPKEHLTLNFKSADFVVSTSDIFPNWYIHKRGGKSAVIKSTANKSNNFVAPFNTSAQWKRYKQDKYHPITVMDRYHINSDVKDFGYAPADRIIPTPFYMTVDEDKKVDLSFIKHKDDYESVTWQQAYTLKVDASSNRVLITASTAVGAFYAIQSLLAAGKFADRLFQIPEMLIKDEPRFEYRGLQLDVSRNFQTKAEILKILNTMALYKLNKFHFHLTDDEGWRLEIPGLIELTEFGSNRCHGDSSETKCLKPQLGSGPFQDTSGSGFYSVEDYREILRHASSLHIQVIPEFDMPGHSFAAIKSMELRYIKSTIGKQKNDSNGQQRKNLPWKSSTEFLLSEFGDNSSYMSVQHFKNNSMNPCITSTYTFIHHIIKSVKKMHEDIQPLKMFHYGGDEVPNKAWSKSPACKKLIERDLNIKDRQGLKKYFAKRVFELLETEDLDIGAWEDGLMDIYGYAWQNVWEWNRAHIAYEMANNNYKVVLGHATHLYFDHAQEPNPEEKGLYWATRYTSMRKTFGYLPDDLFGNADYKITGDAIDLQEICQDGYGSPPLVRDNP